MDQNSTSDRKSDSYRSAGAVGLVTSSNHTQSHSSIGSSTEKQVKQSLSNAFSSIQKDDAKIEKSVGDIKNKTTKAVAQAFDGKSNEQSNASNNSSDKDKDKAISQSFEDKTKSKPSNSSPSSNSGNSFAFSEEALHVDAKSIDKVTTLDGNKVQEEKNLGGRLGNGSFFDPGGGQNTVIAGSGNDIVRGDGRGFNTIAGGDGSNTFVLGKETTNRVLDFDPKKDSFLLSGALKVGDIAFGQGTNPTKAGLDTPLDGAANAVVFDKNGGNHILASLPFVNASDLSEKNFGTVSNAQLNKVAQSA